MRLGQAESISFGNRTAGFGLGEDAPHLFVIGDSQACGVTGCGSDSTKPCTKDTTLNGTPARVYCKVGAHTSEFTAVVPTLGIGRGDTVIIFLGSNDYDSKPDPTPIVRAIEAAGASYLWVGPPAIRGKEGTAPAHLQSVLGDKYFDSRALNLQLRDGIHPTASEFARWRAAVLAEVANKLKSTPTTAVGNSLATLRRPVVVVAAVLGVAAIGGGIYLATRPVRRRLVVVGETRHRVRSARWVKPSHAEMFANGKPIVITKMGRKYTVTVMGHPVVRGSDGKLTFQGRSDVPEGATPEKFTKDDAKHIAHQIGHYMLGLGDFVDTYIEGY